MIEIRKATENDLQTIHDMAQVVFRHTYRGILSPEQMEYMMDMMYSMPNLQKQLDEGHHFYIAYEAAIPCGYVSVQYEGPDPDGIEVFHLHKIYVMPDAQGRGVGLKLFRTVVDHVRAALLESDPVCVSPTTVCSSPATCIAPPHRPARIELNVNKFNAAVNFYRHLGMRVLLEEDFPIGNGFYKTDYIMGLDVLNEEIEK